MGGGLGGSTFAKAMAEAGLQVLVLERETQFRDRVRGETMHPWGVAEARELGILDLLLSTCGHEVPWFDVYSGGECIRHLQAAADAGADVRRGAHIREVRGGAQVEVTIERSGGDERVRTRLVVGADGRASMTRRWAGFGAQRGPQKGSDGRYAL